MAYSKVSAFVACLVLWQAEAGVTCKGGAKALDCSQCPKRKCGGDCTFSGTPGACIPLEAAPLNTQFNIFLGKEGDEKVPRAAGQKDAAPAVCPRCKAPFAVGPILVLYISSNGKPPVQTLAQVKEWMTGGPPSFADMIRYSSYGQSTLATGDVEYMELSTTEDTDRWSIVDARNWVKQQQAVQIKATQRTFNKIMAIVAGETYGATAFSPGTFSDYRGGAISWGTFCHEIGHNWGLDHADGFTRGHNAKGQYGYEYYADDATLGYQRNYRKPDYTAVARYNLGWIPKSEVATYPTVSSPRIQALNEGLSDNGMYLLMTVPCPLCKSLRPLAPQWGFTAETANKGGHLYLSFRVTDVNSMYGVSDQTSRNSDIDEIKKPSHLLKMENRVHVHYQITGDSATELWNTINVGDTWEVPFNAGIFIKVRSMVIAAKPRFADVCVGNTLESANLCTGAAVAPVGGAAPGAPGVGWAPATTIAPPPPPPPAPGHGPENLKEDLQAVAGSSAARLYDAKVKVSKKDKPIAQVWQYSMIAAVSMFLLGAFVTYTRGSARGFIGDQVDEEALVPFE